MSGMAESDQAPALNRTLEQRPRPRVRTVTLPWASLIAALAGIAYLIIATEPALARFYQLPPLLLRPEAKYATLALVVLAVAWDLRRFRHQHARQRADLEALREQIDALWARNKALQRKAHTYSEHADKLKYFISDKLLESLEYDEKFLHFKGIAAEVRHNGVISFDKVQTALQRAAADAAEQDGGPAGGAPGPYHEALEALHYLWDLLDLSTAENLTLHIGNLLCEYEEQYCQRLLGGEEAQALPHEPAYAPQRAAWRALTVVHPEPLPEPEGGTTYRVDGPTVYARLEPVGELLGKENHLVLLLENLLRNAQFYACKRGYSAAFAPIALTLTEADGDVCIRVYNRGPAIRDADRAALFQLGYSTRRRRDRHGRGLGLYFVNEIVKGYEGSIRVDNIEPLAGRYAVTIATQEGETVDGAVEVALDNGRPRCVTGDRDGGRATEWRLRAPVERVTITDPVGHSETLEGLTGEAEQVLFDPAHPERPHWRVRYRPRRHAHRVVFEPLAIRGVEFCVRLPTAQRRLSSAWLDPDAPTDAATGLEPSLPPSEAPDA